MDSSSSAPPESGSAEDPPPSSAAASPPAPPPPSRYESQKRRDWNTFLQHLRNHKPTPIPLARCCSANVLDFLNYLDQFGKTKVHVTTCPHFGCPEPPSPCNCPLRQAWGSLDALIGRLRAAYEENGGSADDNPFAARAVQNHLREVREGQALARGIPYEKRKRKRNVLPPRLSLLAPPPRNEEGGSSSNTTTDVGPATTTPPAAE